jgi:hypothetical protein
MAHPWKPNLHAELQPWKSEDKNNICAVCSMYQETNASDYNSPLQEETKFEEWTIYIKISWNLAE